jgi:hypothetical protein
MADRVECFLLTPSEYAQESLRRYSSTQDEKCFPFGYHNASVPIGTLPFPHSDLDGKPGKGIGHEDPRWPKTCACGYVFQDTDAWQHNIIRLYQRSDHVTLMTTLAEAPIGALWDADWYNWKGPDGRCLVLKTPGGDWVIDGPSSSNDGSKGPPWTRTGEVPMVTASPSIHFPGKFHGWLRNGILESC